MSLFKKLFLTLLLLCFSFVLAAAQDLIDMEFDSYDSLFAEPLPEPETSEEPDSSVLDSVRQRGLHMIASYNIHGLFAPGWSLAPWHFNGSESLSWEPGFKMTGAIRINAQISEFFRVMSYFEYSIPNFDFTLEEFFFDYNFFNSVFLRAGKYEQTWGISPNFGFTNLLKRVPDEETVGASYLLKFDIPVGVGGIQTVAITRADIVDGKAPSIGQVGFGGKYNFAYRWADFDLGIMYQETMATRAFLSIKTTFGNTEVYNEWLLAVNTHSNYKTGFAANIGFAQDFFDNRIGMNGELFYNGEGESYYFIPETEIRDEESIPFVRGFNAALNLLYRFKGKSNPRFFTQILYVPEQSSAQLVPGFRFSPLSNMDVYFAVPLALGPKNGYYYNYNADPADRPFSIMMLVTFNGSVQTGYFY